MEWFLKLHQDIVIIHTVEKTGNYAWGAIHIDAFYDAHNEYWYQKLVNEGSVTVKLEGGWI